MGLGQVQSPGPHEQHRRIVDEGVGAVAGGVHEADVAAHRVAEVHLAVDDVVEGGRGGVLEVRHEQVCPGARALMTILRLTGPVISTCRRRRAGGAGDTRQLSPSRMAAVSGSKPSVAPASRAA